MGSTADNRIRPANTHRSLHPLTDRPRLHIKQLWKVLAMDFILQTRKINVEETTSILLPPFLFLFTLVGGPLPQLLIEGPLPRLLVGGLLLQLLVGGPRLLVGGPSLRLLVGGPLPQLLVEGLLLQLLVEGLFQFHAEVLPLQVHARYPV